MEKSDFERQEYPDQLMASLNVLLEHADDGVIHGGSVPQILVQSFGIAPFRARTISQDLGFLGLRESTRKGKRHTHFIKSPASGKITAEDMARLVVSKEEKATAQPSKSKPAAKTVRTVDANADVESLLKVIALLEDGAEKARDLVKKLREEKKKEADRADKAEGENRRLRDEIESLNSRLNTKPTSDPRVQAVRAKYQV